MAGWKLEVCKMAIYMAFPVTLFHLFNQPGYFEEWVTKTKRELYPPDHLAHREELQKAIYEMREKRQMEVMKTLDDIEQKRSKQ